MESTLNQPNGFTEKMTTITNSVATKFVHSVCIGIVGSVLLLFFGSLVVQGDGLAVLLPWIIGFNGLVTGYSLINKTNGTLSTKYIWLAAAGLLMAVPLYFIINLAPVFPFYISANSFFLSLFIAVISTLAGGWVAVKNQNHKASEKGTGQE